MPTIDQRKIEEWKRLAEFERTDGCDKRELRELAGEAVPALLSEREEMLALLRDEILPFVDHTIDAYTCGRGLMLKARLAAILGRK